jgi:hypothetical protein
MASATSLLEKICRSQIQSDGSWRRQQANHLKPGSAQLHPGTANFLPAYWTSAGVSFAQSRAVQKHADI